jgi:hypothetical protein
MRIVDVLDAGDGESCSKTGSFVMLAFGGIRENAALDRRRWLQLNVILCRKSITTSIFNRCSVCSKGKTFVD